MTRLDRPGVRDIIVVGGGHNGLVAGCYPAKGGHDVLVVEALAEAGGGSRTAETVPGYRFDLHSAAHNIINMTAIPKELDLSGAGLEYQEMDPFSTAHSRGRPTSPLSSLRRGDANEARAYADFMRVAVPLVEMVMPASVAR